MKSLAFISKMIVAACSSGLIHPDVASPAQTPRSAVSVASPLLCTVSLLSQLVTRNILGCVCDIRDARVAHRPLQLCQPQAVADAQGSGVAREKGHIEAGRSAGIRMSLLTSFEACAILSKAVSAPTAAL